MTRSRLGFQLGALLTIGLGWLLTSSAAQAACVNDDDCPNAACGGDICDYSSGTPTCKPAGTSAQGQDGWCTTTQNCKCASVGATCQIVYCSFTKPPAGSSTGTGGSAALGTGGAGTGGVSAGSGGAAAGTGGKTGTGGTSTAGPSASSSSGGGCSLAGNGAPATGRALIALFLAAGFGLARTRRRD